MKKLLIMILFWLISFDIAYATPASLISYAARFAPFIIIAILIIALIIWLIIKKNSASDKEAE